MDMTPTAVCLCTRPQQILPSAHHLNDELRLRSHHSSPCTCRHANGHANNLVQKLDQTCSAQTLRGLGELDR